jgi:predicted transcriptional regulator
MAIHVFTIRFSDAQHRLLEKLAKKLNIDKTNVIRLAVTRLGEAERLLGDQGRS